MKLRYMWLCFSLLTGLLFVQEVSAQQVPLANAYTAIGRFATNQGYLVSYNPSTGACARRAIGGANGLTGTTYITGTTSSDWIFAISTFGGTHCGAWGAINPIVTNGYSVVVNPGNLTDVVDGGYLNNALLGGDAGDDIVLSSGSNCILYGWTGNDKLYGSWGTTLRGEDGNDTMCSVNGATVWQFVGGLGSDTYCGNWSIAPSSASYNCGGC